MSGTSVRRYAVACALRLARRGGAVVVLAVSMAALALAIPALVVTLAANAWPVVARLNVAPEATVFASSGAGAKELRELQSKLEQAAAVASVRLVARDAALAELTERAGLAGALAQLNVNPLPDALIVRFRTATGPDEVESAVAGFGKLARVDSVQVDVRWYRKLLAVARAAAWTGGGLGAAALLLVMLILVGAIRLLAATSADEFRALRRMGADRAFLVRPFAYLGAGALLVAAALAGAGVWAATEALQQPARELAAAYGGELRLQLPAWPWWAAGLAAATAVGAAVGALAAAAALRRLRD